MKKYVYMRVRYNGADFIDWLNAHGKHGWLVVDMKRETHKDTPGVCPSLDVVFVREDRGGGDL